MNEIVFLVEELSIVPVIEVIVSEIVPDDIVTRIIPHQGKSDLQKSIPRKLRGWANPNAQFVILHDQDSNNCRSLKSELKNLCPEDKRQSVLIRIVCVELESWFFGDLEAVRIAFPKRKIRNVLAQSGFRETDKIRNASSELLKFVPEYQKVSGARLISENLVIKRNVSVSFQMFVQGLRRVIQRFYE